MIKLKEFVAHLCDEDRIVIYQGNDLTRTVHQKTWPLPTELAEGRVLNFCVDDMDKEAIQVLISPPEADEPTRESCEGGAGPNRQATEQSISLDPIQLTQDGNATLKSITISMYLNFEPKPDPA